MDNVITTYVYDQFHVSLAVAGMLGSVFGMLNIISRPSGGLLSDYVARRWGMRGRLWAMWIVQTLSGVFCVLLGLTSHSLGATMAILIIFSIFCQQSCGLSFGVSGRGLGCRTAGWGWAGGWVGLPRRHRGACSGRAAARAAPGRRLTAASPLPTSPPQPCAA